LVVLRGHHSPFNDKESCKNNNKEGKQKIKPKPKKIWRRVASSAPWGEVVVVGVKV
jgi:hypothetical protein